MTNIIRQPCDEGVIRGAGPASAVCERSAAPWVLAATILGSGIVLIDGTVVNVALPVIQDKLNASAADAQWIVESYALFLAALILVGGSMGDHFGRRRVFTIGVGLFALASVWCGLAPNAEQLIAARAVQGVGGALLVPGSLAIISASFAEDQRGRAIGTWVGFTAIIAAAGPLVGGWLVENISWRWAFLINVPLAVVVILISYRHVPESRDDELTGGLDWLGAVLATIGLGALVFGLIETPARGMGDTLVLASLLGGTAALAAFVLREAQARSPMMPLGLFASRTFGGANLLTFLLYAALGGGLYYLPFNLIQVQGYTATGAAAALVPMFVLLFLFSRSTGGIVVRFGTKLPLIIGPSIAAVGFTAFSLPGIGGSYWTTFFPAIVALGIGMTITMAPLTTAVMGAVPSHEADTASGVNNAVARAAALLAVAVLGIVIANAFNSTLDDRLAGVQLTPQGQAGPGGAAQQARRCGGPDWCERGAESADRARD